MKAFKFLFVFAGFLFLTAALSAAEEVTVPSKPLFLDLKTAMQIAAERNVKVITADQRVQEAVARLGQAVSAFLPRFSLDASQYRQTRDIAASGIPIPLTNPVVGPFNTFDARMTLSQTLFDAQAIARFGAARAGKRFSKAEQKKIHQDILALSASLYIQARRAQETVEAGQALVMRDEERLRLMETRRQLGTASEVEELQSKKDLAESRHVLAQAEASEAERRLDLLAALGYSDQPVIFPPKEKIKNFYEPSPEETQAALEDHPDIEAAKEQVNQDKAEKRAQLAGFLPKVSGMMDYGDSGLTPSDAKKTYTIGAKVTLPVFEGGSNFFGWKAARSRLKESEAELEDTQRQTAAHSLAAIQDVQQSHSLVKSKSAELKFSGKQWALSKEKLESGLGSQLEVIEAYTARKLAKEEKKDASAAYLMAQVNLAHALGQMDDFLKTLENTHE